MSLTNKISVIFTLLILCLVNEGRLISIFLENKPIELPFTVSNSDSLDRSKQKNHSLSNISEYKLPLFDKLTFDSLFYKSINYNLIEIIMPDSKYPFSMFNYSILIEAEDVDRTDKEWVSFIENFVSRHDSTLVTVSGNMLLSEKQRIAGKFAEINGLSGAEYLDVNNKKMWESLWLPNYLKQVVIDDSVLISNAVSICFTDNCLDNSLSAMSYQYFEENYDVINLGAIVFLPNSRKDFLTSRLWIERIRDNGVSSSYINLKFIPDEHGFIPIINSYNRFMRSVSDFIYPVVKSSGFNYSGLLFLIGLIITAFKNKVFVFVTYISAPILTFTLIMSINLSLEHYESTSFLGGLCVILMALCFFTTERLIFSLIIAVLASIFVLSVPPEYHYGLAFLLLGMLMTNILSLISSMVFSASGYRKAVKQSFLSLDYERTLSIMSYDTRGYIVKSRFLFLELFFKEKYWLVGDKDMDFAFFSSKYLKLATKDVPPTTEYPAWIIPIKKPLIFGKITSHGVNPFEIEMKWGESFKDYIDSPKISSSLRSSRTIKHWSDSVKSKLLLVEEVFDSAMSCSFVLDGKDVIFYKICEQKAFEDEFLLNTIREFPDFTVELNAATSVLGVSIFNRLLAESYVHHIESGNSNDIDVNFAKLVSIYTSPLYIDDDIQGVIKALGSVIPLKSTQEVPRYLIDTIEVFINTNFVPRKDPIDIGSLEIDSPYKISDEHASSYISLLMVLCAFILREKLEISLLCKYGVGYSVSDWIDMPLPELRQEGI